MTLVERLQATGVELRQQIGFIIEYCNEAGQWRAKHAHLGWVCTSIPTEVLGAEGTQTFNPKSCIAVLVKIRNQPQVCILSVIGNYTLYSFTCGGLIIETQKNRIHIGQSDEFIDSVCGTCCALAQ